MYILITGGAGFIGSKLAIRLNKEGHYVDILDIFSPQVHGNKEQIVQKQAYLATFTNVHKGDIRNYELLAPLVRRANVIIHLAAETGVGQSMYDCRQYVSVNDLGTATLVEALIKEKHKVRKILLISSRAIYGEGAYLTTQGKIKVPPPRQIADMLTGKWEPHNSNIKYPIEPIPTTETTPPSSVSIYGMTKYNQELLLGILSHTLKTPVIILRLFNVYGEGQSLQNPYTGILTVFANCILNEIAPTVYEDGQQSRDFVHVDDVVQSVHLALNASNLDTHSVFNIGSGKRITILELAKQMIKTYGSNLVPKISGEFRVGDIRHSFADISHAHKSLGYQPQVKLTEGLHRFIKWTNASAYNVMKIDDATKELKRYGFWGHKKT